VIALDRAPIERYDCSIEGRGKEAAGAPGIGVAAPSSKECAFMQLSLVAEGRKEADVFKWIESQKVGYDLGETAIKRWVQEHWDGYLRARWIQHLEGTVFWTELGEKEFGLLKHRFQDQALLLDRITDFLKAGKENLDILLWSIDWRINREDVLAILQELDINSKRLIQFFDAA
jgi:hypothetical protein